ncbi:MAG: RNA polymerase sigma factor [Planctomycetota bacterium]|jgi:RNA polymerase sigma-70 factor (ECF subfamily)
MIEDEVLKWRFKRGSREALRRIYEKYRDYLLTLGMALLNDTVAAEDVVHDVFVHFVNSSEKFRLRGSLKGYLATCVMNRARDYARRNRRQSAALGNVDMTARKPGEPENLVICSEQAEELNRAIARLPYEQREAVVLHLVAGMKLRDVAQRQDVTVNTVKARYRYGMNKLRSLMNA